MCSARDSRFIFRVIMIQFHGLSPVILLEILEFSSISPGQSRGTTKKQVVTTHFKIFIFSQYMTVFPLTLPFIINSALLNNPPYLLDSKEETLHMDKIIKYIESNRSVLFIVQHINIYYVTIM